MKAFIEEYSLFFAYVLILSLALSLCTKLPDIKFHNQEITQYTLKENERKIIVYEKSN